MASATELMAAGAPAGLARQIGGSTATGLTATGTTATDAYDLTASNSVFSTVGSGSGAQLPFASGQPNSAIRNGGSNALTVYPQTGETVNGTTSFSVTNGKSALFMPNGTDWIAVLSA